MPLCRVIPTCSVRAGDVRPLVPAYVEMLARDESRLQDTLKRLDVSPLGCGALAGTAYDIDREQLADWLGFASATRNSRTAFLTVTTYWSCSPMRRLAWFTCHVSPKI